MTSSRASGGTKTAGILIVVASAIMLIAGVVMMPSGSGAATDGKASGSSAESSDSQSSNETTGAVEDADSKREKRRKNREDNKAPDPAPNAAPADGPKPAEQSKIGGLNIGTDPAAEPAPKNAADVKENGEQKAPGGFGAAKQIVKEKEGEKK